MNCIEAGIRAVHPDAVFADKVETEGDTLHVDGATHDLSAYDEVYVGGRNAAGHVAGVL